MGDIPPSSGTVTQGETVKIGVLLPLSGGGAYYGEVQLNGIEFCADYVKLQELSEKQTQLEAQLEEKMERWMYLNELNEKILAQK